ncbi:membrane protein insertase YidC [Aestuariibacter salexigens]|uniref:membrane protein insertase YidC n=1 Tax=Aestuariibacter salexigens TaxID=226010 RepID=UPI0004178FB7|nr:membrane protein insertase YidC [Aestuariibacter salexigens]
MESQRSFLVIGLALVSFLLWQQWQIDYGPAPVQDVTSEQQLNDSGAPSGTSDSASSEFVPVDESTPVEPSVNRPENGAQRIRVLTDTLDLLIDTRGGDVVSAELEKFPVEQGSDMSYSLLRAQDAALYVAQSGLIGTDGPDALPTGRPVYSVTQQAFELQGDSLSVPLTWTNEQGLTITKTYVFERDSHTVGLEYTVTNNTERSAQVQAYGQLKQTLAQPEGNMFMPTYRGAAFSTQEERYEKYSFDDISDTNLREVTEGGWVAMLEHYFLSAWVPPQTEVNNLYSRTLNGRYAAIGFTGAPVVVEPGQSTVLSSALYLGPKDQDTLAQLARGLDLTVDYGILWWISQPLFALLQFIHDLVGNWGIAIIVITIIVKGAMYPLTKAQYESMAKLRALAPKMQALKERYGDDRQKMSQGMMELYKKEKVNPMGGCFPLLLQMPIFLALYWVFLESVELRHADFFLWITDLSVKDPYFVLPVLTGASMYLLQKLQPMTVTDPMQQKIMQWMPVMMSIFFLWFPAGLVLYWLISNVITLIQAKLIYASMDKRGIKTH